MSFLLLAHRGANRQAPENSVAAFRLALEAGCDGCECDVQLSRDGVLVVSHDETLTRIAGLAHRIPDMTASQLAALRLRGPGQFPTTETSIPSLETVWRLHQRQRKTLLVELKYFREEHTPRERLGEALVQFVQTHRPGARFHAISFDEPLLQWLKQRLPSLRTGYVFDHPSRFAQHQADCPHWADLLLPRADCATAALVAWAKQVQRPVVVWVADDEPTMARLAALGVDGLATNEPARLVAWAKHRG